MENYIERGPGDEPEEEPQEIYELKIRRTRRKYMLVRVDGTKALLTNRMSDLSRKSLGKQPMTKEEKLQVLDPEYQYQQSVYRDNEGGYYFPSMGVLLSMLKVGEVDGKDENRLRHWISLATDDPVLRIYLPDDTARGIPADQRGPEMRQDIARNWQARGVKVVATRAMFRCPWSIVIPIVYNASRMTRDQVLSVIEEAGFSVGIGCWRPDRKGLFGQFKISEVEEVKG
jgi:hypothetical protein